MTPEELIASAPRDVEGFRSWKKVDRLRLGTAIRMFGSNSDLAAQNAFILLPEAKQIEELLGALLRYDAQTPATAGTPAPTPPTATPAAQSAVVPRGAPAPMQNVPRTPSTGSDPTNKGTTRPDATAGTDEVPTIAQAAQAAEAFTDLARKLEEIQNDIGLSSVEVTELTDLVLGVARTQQLIASLCLTICEHVLAVPKEAVIRLAQSDLDEGSTVTLLSDLADETGK